MRTDDSWDDEPSDEELADHAAFTRLVGGNPEGDPKKAAMIAVRKRILEARREIAGLRQALDTMGARVSALEANVAVAPAPQGRTSDATVHPRQPETTARPAKAPKKPRRIRVNFVDPPRPAKKERVVEVEVA